MRRAVGQWGSGAVGQWGSWQLAVGSWQLAVGSWQLLVVSCQRDRGDATYPPGTSVVGESPLVDAMVLSGCRICSNLTNETIQIGGGTHRQCKRTKERKIGEGKANPRGS